MTFLGMFKMKTKFVHIRAVNKDGIVLGNGGGTVAFEIDDAGYVTRFASSICHPRDNFSRYLGRVKAEGRLQSKTYCVYLNDNEIHEKEFVQKMRTVGWEMLQDLPRIESSQSSLGSSDC